MIGINALRVVERASVIAYLMVMSCELWANEHTVDFATRLRYADLKEGEQNGLASSALLRVSVQSEWSRRLSSFVEIDHVATGFKDQHNDAVRLNGKPTIPDVPGTELNQGFLQFKSRSSRITLGRQVIEFDQQRFIGSVNFWQNEQSFDALRMDYRLFSSSRFNYAYIANANRIFGDEAGTFLPPTDSPYDGVQGERRPVNALGDHAHDTHLLRAEINEWDYSKFVLYSYLIDNHDAEATSNNTFGANFTFKYKPGIFHYAIDLGLATQERVEIDTHPRPSYGAIDVGIAYQSFELSLAMERFGVDRQTPFIAPLGSLHEFNGWADQFSVVPTAGLLDKKIQWVWRRTPWRLDMRYHAFDAVVGSQSLGEEVDVDIIYDIAEKHVLMLRFADYKAPANDAGLQDVRRIFLNYSYNM